jgi:predicted O-methyltransferase YrrM
MDFDRAWLILEKIPSFISKEECRFITSLIDTMPVKATAPTIGGNHGICVDVGGGRGRSAVCLVLAGATEVHTIAIWDAKNNDGTKDEFVENIRRAGVAGSISITNKPSVMAAAMRQQQGFFCDLVFIDAAHDEASVRADIAAWRPMLHPGGIMVFHDKTSIHPGVLAALADVKDKVIGQVETVVAYEVEGE